ncbi:uncharacterized protein inaF-D isoform X2 [Battus philenor]|uniref:uncharacterized protein inaF-D isoform X2 n=1 Tax=Battus philenor TaxID=42288 RepID=UPI0035D128D8
MSGSVQNEESGKDDGDASRDMHRPKSVSTVVRVMTVMAYLLSVSMAAILLSVYYVFVWKSPEAPADVARLSARQGDHHEYQQNYAADNLPFGYPGRGNFTVNDNTTDPIPSNMLEPMYESTREPTGLDLPANITTESPSQSKSHAHPPSVATRSNDTNIIT